MLHQLIISIISIALSAAALLATLNYTPWWNKPANAIEETVRVALPLIDQGYALAVRANGGTPPVPTPTTDGGFAAYWQPYLQLLPSAPPKMEWVYGVHPVDASAFSGLPYVCAYSTEGVDRAHFLGIRRAVAYGYMNRAFQGSSCGATAHSAEPSSYPVSHAVTLYLLYHPEVTR